MFLFCENSTRDATFGGMGKSDEDSVGGTKFHKDNKWTTFRIANKNSLIVKMAWEIGMKSILKYLRRHLIEMFPRPKYPNQKDKRFFSEK